MQSSSYAKVGGIPVAVLGLAGYLVIATALLLRGEQARLAAAGCAVIGFSFSAYLTYLELNIVHAICQWCIASAILMTASAILTVTASLRPSPSGRAQSAPSSDVQTSTHSRQTCSQVAQCA